MGCYYSNCLFWAAQGAQMAAVLPERLTMPGAPECLGGIYSAAANKKVGGLALSQRCRACECSVP